MKIHQGLSSSVVMLNDGPKIKISSSTYVLSTIFWPYSFSRFAIDIFFSLRNLSFSEIVTLAINIEKAPQNLNLRSGR